MLNFKRNHGPKKNKESKMNKELTINEVIKEKLTWGEVVRHYDPKITDDKVDYILWNETCYPFDNETTVKQIYQLFKKQGE